MRRCGRRTPPQPGSGQFSKLTGIEETGAAGFGRSAALSADGSTAPIGGPADDNQVSFGVRRTRRHGARTVTIALRFLGNRWLGATSAKRFRVRVPKASR